MRCWLIGPRLDYGFRILTPLRLVDGYRHFGGILGDEVLGPTSTPECGSVKNPHCHILEDIVVFSE